MRGGGASFDAFEWLADGCRAIRRTALSRRDGAQVMARPRPRVATSRVQFEENVKTVMRAGLADMEARLTMQTLRRYAIGSALQEQSNKGAAASVGIVGTGEEGFEIVGGGAHLAGLDLVLREETGIPVIVAEDPLLAVVNGTGSVLEDLPRYRGLLF